MNNVLHFQEWSHPIELKMFMWEAWIWFCPRLLVSHRESFYLLNELSMVLYSLIRITRFVLLMTNAWLRWNQNSLLIAINLPHLSVHPSAHLSVCMYVCTYKFAPSGCNQYLGLTVCPSSYADITTTRGSSTRPKGKDSPISSISTNLCWSTTLSSTWALVCI